eukprot:Hpha_TRINITY_DN8997_c0_g1::TRINITY_DN8997_c0_g1_i1::g.80717::m.80717
MHRRTPQDQEQYMKRSGAMFLLNTCAAELSAFRPRDPAVFLRGLLSRTLGLKLSLPELSAFVRESVAVHPGLLLRTLLLSCPPDADLNDAAWSEVMHSSADLFADLCSSPASLQELSDTFVREKQPPPLVRLTLVLAKCKMMLREHGKPTHLTVVVPLRDAGAVLRRPSEHPDGEDLLRRQSAQMRWLVSQQPSVTWQLLYVDECCPQSSGAVAAQQLPGDKQVRVVWLQDGVNDDQVAPGTNLPPSHWLRDCTPEAMLHHGAAYAYGMHVAATSAACQPGDQQFVILHPPDSRTHLAQSALLLSELTGGAEITIGDPFHPESVPRLKVNRPDRVFAHVWHRILPGCTGVNANWRLYAAVRSSLARDLAPQLVCRTCPLFPLEILVRCALRKGSDKIGKAPLMQFGAFSFGASLEHSSLLRQFAELTRKLGHDYPAAGDAVSRGSEWIEFAESLTPHRWSLVLNSVAADVVGAQGMDDGMPARHQCAPTLAEFMKSDEWDEELRRQKEEEEAEKQRQEEEKKVEEERQRKTVRRRSKR